jgi:hypothetical protein
MVNSVTKAVTYVCYVMYLLFVSDFNQNSNVLTNFRNKSTT